MDNTITADEKRAVVNAVRAKGHNFVAAWKASRDEVIAGRKGTYMPACVIGDLLVTSHAPEIRSRQTENWGNFLTTNSEKQT